MLPNNVGNTSTANGSGGGAPPKTTVKKMTWLQRISMAINRGMETFFYRWGFMVASHPIHCIIGCLCLTIVCGLGMLNFNIETRPYKLWLRRDSPFTLDTTWLHENVMAPLRPSLALVTADNVLEPEVIQALVKIHQAVKQISVEGGKNFEDLCYKLPITTKVEQEERRRRRRKRALEEITEGSHSGHNNSVHQGRPAFDPLFGSSFSDFDDEFGSDSFFSENELDSPRNASDGSPTDLHTFDPMLSLPEDIYCFMLENLEEACFEVNPIELWSYNATLVANLTLADIIQVFNSRFISPVFGRFVNFTAELGGPDIQTDSQGRVIKAQSIELKWFVKVNQDEIRAGRGIADESTGEVADKTTLQWEAEFMRVMENISVAGMPPGVKLYYATSRSFGDICMGQINDDGLMLAVGFLVMFAYVSVMLGRFNVVEQRPLVSVAGIFCIGFSVIIACGICSAFSIFSGPVNQILPFLILGIGVDDMFVIVQCWNNLYPNFLSSKKPSKQSIPERMGCALQHAGVSITVTSLTDIAAFGVGAFTTLPGLQSFSIYAAMSVLAVFFLQSTWFVAWFAIDQKRLENRQNGMCCHIQYSSDYVPNKLSQKSYCQIFFNEYFTNALLSSWVSKAGVILTTMALLAATLYGNSQLKQDFDPMWLLPTNSHLVKFINAREHNYPGIGVQGLVIANQVNWTSSFNEMEAFVKGFQDSGSIYKFDSWYTDFKEYSNRNFGTNIPVKDLDPKKFRRYMGKFLYSPTGSKHRAHFRFDGDFSCGEKMPPVKMVMMPFQFKYFPSTEERISGMREIKNFAKNANLTFEQNATDPRIFAFAAHFVQWESDETMADELFGSVSLSLTCVLITIFLLLADIRMCLLCGICVVFTMINVGGFMYYWGIAINIISSILIVLSIGLCVDYAAHIGLAFLITPGASKNFRAKEALKNIGPAVLNGGFSTFLSISMMATSKSLAFISFFKIFTIVVVFGLWHGIFFLPVILSLGGPDPYPNAQQGESSSSSATANALTAADSNKVVNIALVPEAEDSVILPLQPRQTTLNCNHTNGKHACDNGNSSSVTRGEHERDVEESGEGENVREALMFIDEEEDAVNDADNNA